MKKIIEMKSFLIIINIYNIIIDELYNHFKENFILRITLNFDKDIYIEKIMNINVIKKRKFNQVL